MAHFDFNAHQKDHVNLQLDDFNYLNISPRLNQFLYKYCGDKNKNSNSCHNIYFTL